MARGLNNIDVQTRNILEIGADLGIFDYIICHGTFSWVNHEVQEKMFEFATQYLAPDGLAYISYNTYPGWRMRGVARDLMCFHAGRYDGSQDRADQVRMVLEFMASVAGPFDQTYGNLLKEEAEYVGRRPDSYLLHDHLEMINDPIYFNEFTARARAHGLRFVSEVQGSLLRLENLSPAVQDGLRRFARDDLDVEQYLDFLINRKFRQSVLCHTANAVTSTASTHDVAKLYVSAPRPPSGIPATLRNEVLLRAAIDHMAPIWPLSMPCESLAREARAKINPGTSDDPWNAAKDLDDLAFDLRSSYNLKLVELQTNHAPFVLEAQREAAREPTRTAPGRCREHGDQSSSRGWPVKRF